MTFSRRGVFVFFLASAISGSVPASSAEREAVGFLASTRGDVTVDGQPAHSSTPVYPDSKVKTGNGKTAVLLNGESVIQMTFDSELVIKNVLRKAPGESGSEIDLEHGKVRALVRDKGGPKRYVIRTRSAVMGVRGTEVFIDAPQGRGASFFAVVEGSTTVTPMGAPGGPPPQPINLPQNQGFGGSVGNKAPQSLSAQQARELASSVAPPRVETLALGEVLHSASQGSDASKSGPIPSQPSQGTGPKLDPVTNSFIAPGGSTPASAVLVPTSKKL